MNPKQKSKTLLSITRSKAKMYEYGIPDEYHIDIPNDPMRLMSLAIGMLGDYASQLSELPLTERLVTQDHELNFSAYYFEAYYQPKLISKVEPYLILLGAVSYYLCDLPGSSVVLMKHLDNDLDLEAEGLERLIVFLLKNSPDSFVNVYGRFARIIVLVAGAVLEYRQTGLGVTEIFSLTDLLRKRIYEEGSARQLLFVDVISAVIRVIYENSCWRCLPEYSGLPSKSWDTTIKKPSFIKELWPAQRLLGRRGVFEGKSAVIQMPTSAGKTRATEIIIRSAFLAGRTEIAIIVAPFKALCHEISDALSKSFAEESISVEELSDVIQNDIDLFVTDIKQQIFVVTPEKLVYLLKQSPQFANGVGLLIYDEGHQFDTGSRGVTFELLLTALKSIITKPQTVLISAVLSNAEAISEWLTPEGSEVVSGIGLSPNFRSIAFSSWTSTLGQLHFVNEKEPTKEEFFVPRVIESYNLGRSKGAKKDRFFPEKSEPNTVSLYLGLKLVPNGGVAVFCGTKSTANALCKKIVEAYRQGLSLSRPLTYSNAQEVERLVLLHEKNLGIDENVTAAARLGVFNHHNNIPTGIRLSVEYAMREGLAKFVLCTSTLSQGVNLPIRYLIVSGLQQGMEGIKTRDFHNLIGRAGRSGMHTEGSIIFGNPEVYDNKQYRSSNWRWQQAINLFRPDSSEPCNSHLLTILDGFYNINTKSIAPGFDVLSFCDQYIYNVPLVNIVPESIANTIKELQFIKESIQDQVRSKLQILASVESYLMSYAADAELRTENGVAQLASNTLAYHLATDEGKVKLIQVFELLEDNIKKITPTYARRRVLGKTLFGLQKSIELEDWLKSHINELNACFTIDEVWALVWPIVDYNISAKVFTNLTNRDFIKAFAFSWLRGNSFQNLLLILRNNRVEYKWGKQTRKVTIEQTIDLCQNALAYEGSLVIGAMSSILAYLTSDQDLTVDLLRKLQKRLQYGLPNQTAIAFYELGFSDRVVALELSEIPDYAGDRNDILDMLKDNPLSYETALNKYPAYFKQTLSDCLARTL
ncbi:MAG: DEAD/DEAH box helicase [Janthinobacterium lividum]